jgi:hypothetical protein
LDIYAQQQPNLKPSSLNTLARGISLVANEGVDVCDLFDDFGRRLPSPVAGLGINPNQQRPVRSGRV